MILATPVCQRVRSNVSFARLIALSNQIKLLLPDIDIVPDITFRSITIKLLKGRGDRRSIFRIFDSFFPFEFELITRSLNRAIATILATYFLRSHSSIYARKKFVIFFFFLGKISFQRVSNFSNNWWLKRDWNLNLIYIYIFKTIRMDHGSYCRSFRVPKKWSVIEWLDRSQDRESLDTLQVPIDRWHSSPRVLDPDWPRMRSPIYLSFPVPAIIPRLTTAIK